MLNLCSHSQVLPLSACGTSSTCAAKVTILPSLHIYTDLCDYICFRTRCRTSPFYPLSSPPMIAQLHRSPLASLSSTLISSQIQNPALRKMLLLLSYHYAVASLHLTTSEPVRPISRNMSNSPHLPPPHPTLSRNCNHHNTNATDAGTASPSPN